MIAPPQEIGIGQDDLTFNLGGITFVLASPMVIEDLDAWPEVVRTTGNKQRADRINANQIIWDDLKFGMGFFNTKGPLPEEFTDKNQVDPSFNGFYSSTLSTEYIGQITLPLLHNTVTHTNNSSPDHEYGLIRKFGSHLFAFSNDANTSIAKYNPASPNWAQDKDLTSGYTNLLIRGTVETQSGLLAFGGTTGSVGTPWVKYTTASSWSNITPSGMTNTPYSMKAFKGNVYAASYDYTNKQVEIYKSVDDGTTWTAITGMVIGEPDLEFIDLIEYRDASGQAAILLHVPSGLYLLDLAAENIQRITDFGGDGAVTGNFKFGSAREFGGNLYLARKNKLFEFHYTGPWQDISPVTNARINSSVIPPTSVVSALDVGGPWLFVTLTSAAGSSVWKFDGIGYHYVWHSTTGTAPVGVKSIAVFHNTSLDVDELHLTQDITGTSPKVNFIRLDYVLTNPLENTSAKYQTSGTLITPHTDAGMSDVPGAVLGYSISSDVSLLDTESNDNELIKIETEADFAGSFSNGLTWGSDSDLRQKIVVSDDLGVGFNSHFRSQVTLERGSTTTKTPALFSFEAIYDKISDDVHAYIAAVDLKASAEILQANSEGQATLQSLVTIADKKQRSRMTFPGSEIFTGSTTRYVRVKRMPAQWDTPGLSGASFPRVDSGVTILRLEEAMP
jgi:hypothetical protein